VSKCDPRIECIGEIDELNCSVGVLLASPDGASHRNLLIRIQHDLFDLGGALSIPGFASIPADRVEALEAEIAALNSALPPLKEFVLPGGSAGAAACHMARTICRRAERRVAALTEGQAVPSGVLLYLNRLSDLFFVLARTMNQASGHGDVLWRGPSTDSV